MRARAKDRIESAIETLADGDVWWALILYGSCGGIFAALVRGWM